MSDAIQTFIDSVDYFINMSLHNPMYQMLYGYLAVAFVVAIIKQIMSVGRG